jgi:hypothetical protein
MKSAGPPTGMLIAITIMRELRATGRCGLKGNFLTMNDCHCRITRGAVRDCSSLRLGQISLEGRWGLRSRETTSGAGQLAPQNCVPTRSIRRFWLNEVAAAVELR